MAENNTIDWSSLVLSDSFFRKVDGICKKTFGGTPDAEEASTYIIDEISRDNFERCHSFQGNCSPDTYIYRIASTLAVDFLRKREGRLRPPTWLVREGDLWVSVWKEICLERMMVQSVVDRHEQEEFRDPGMISQIISVIKAKLPWCGVSTRPSFSEDEEGDILDRQSDHTSIESEYSDQAAEHGLMMANLFINGADEGAEDYLASAEGDLKSKLAEVIQNVPMTDEERLMLKMHFCDGLTFSAIARALGLAKHQPVRLIRKILNDLREQIEQSELDQLIR